MSKERNLSQDEVVLRHCLEKGKITHVEAMRLYGVESLSSQISRLKRKGYEFSKKVVQFEKEGRTYYNVVYTLVNQQQEEEKENENTFVIEVPKELKSVVIIPNLDSDTKYIKVFKNDKGVYEYKCTKK